MSHEPIAIVGSACRFAGDVNSPSKLWDLLRDPPDLREEIPEERFNVDGFYHPDHGYHGHSNVRHSYFLSQDPGVFDAEFFGVNAVESRAMDPQQRLMLEVVYEALEAAGMNMEGMYGSDTSVFVGSMTADYDSMGTRDLDQLPTYAAVGTSRAILSNRISYFFNWKGPSMTIDTACSSSLVALHNAMQTIRSGDSQVAVVCGSNLVLGPEPYIIESTVKMLSPDGLGRMWDKEANGYARGEGLAAIVIKPLSTSVRDSDHIECLVRETGLNQDGKTAGITVPNALSQRDLIRKTYQRAGLDLRNPKDRPQFFEAHGTGTPAGDPVEAEAIYSAFFAENEIDAEKKPLLHVGSIKTVLGHTEGTAGLAGVLKAMLAIQKSVIPPNLHFKELNPAIHPFYHNLKIPTASIAWPHRGGGEVRRASVNSFGFGGTNAHAILESYDSNSAELSTDASVPVMGPFVFSASSEKALRGSLKAYHEFLDNNQDCNPHDLAYTLRERRSLLQYRIAIPAPTLATLKEQLHAVISGDNAATNTGIVRTLSNTGQKRSRLLAIFTGQGAQYATMGAGLISSCPAARQYIKRLESYLAELPEDDRPSWSLEEMLLAAPENSRVGDSALAQPLNTAIQMLLVDLLGSAGVHLDAVVGHSSGEIAAAYAAGLLSARHSIYVAFYRGLCCRYSRSPNGDMQGAMMAVGTSSDDAQTICDDESFAGRLWLAAVNSSSSVTISGDQDAIEELAISMEDEKKFHRRLRVDKAYHSGHMQACIEPYAKGMKRAGVATTIPDLDSRRGNSQWFSSVENGRLMDRSMPLSSEYWLENLTKPVLFESALSAALQTSSVPFDAVLEIGPHPALQGPASQIIQEAFGTSVPYIGTLERKADALASFSKALGFLWTHCDREAVDLQRFERRALCRENVSFKLLKSLPSYRWNHDTKYWSESRRSRHLRSRPDRVHPLLGHISDESAAQITRWKHVLKPLEMPWLAGHAVQNQTVFPAAGYISTAIEAARRLGTDHDTIQMLDINNFIIHRAIPFQNESDGIEVHIELSRTSAAEADNTRVTTQFKYLAALGGPRGNSDLSLVAEATICVCFGKPDPDLLPERPAEPPHMIQITPRRLYESLSKLEYNFSGVFQPLIELRRKLGLARCVGRRAERTPDCSSLWVHPADLDAAFQTVNLAFSYPGDDQLRHLHLPTTISSIRVNPAAFTSGGNDSSKYFDVDGTWNPSNSLLPTPGFSGNARLYWTSNNDHNPQHAAVQVNSVVLKPVGDSDDNRKIYHSLHYVPTKLDGIAAANQIKVTDNVRDFMELLQRIITFYAVQFDRIVPSDSPSRTDSVIGMNYLEYCAHLKKVLQSGEDDAIKKEWRNDSKQDLMDAIHAIPGAENTPDVKLMLLVGEIMPRVFRGEADMLEEMRASRLMHDFYRHGVGLGEATKWLCASLKQITDRFPHVRILEVGAGSGAATIDILETIGSDFDEYTFTDISTSFLIDAKQAFSLWGDRMSFKTCNVETDPLEQGYAEGEYDVVVASQILHATTCLGDTIRNIRRLLKPGGWLLIGECRPGGALQHAGNFIFGTLPDWWNGMHEGRAPFASDEEWNEVLQQNGFGVIETISPHCAGDIFGITTMAAQAIDERILTITSPLSNANSLDVKEVIVIGGITEQVALIAMEVEQMLVNMGAQVFLYQTIDQLDDRIDQPGVTIISFADVDQPVFEDISSQTWQQLKRTFIGDKSMLWLTSGRLKSGFYCNMTVGFQRSALSEEGELRLQSLDVADISQLKARLVVEAFVRFTNKQILESAGQTILHTVEREILIDEEGRERVPRLAHVPGPNDRLRSTQRAVFRNASLRNQEVALEQNESGRFLRVLSRFDTENATRQLGQEDFLELRTSYSVLSAIRTPLGYRFLVLGYDRHGNKHLALTTSVASVLRLSVMVTMQVKLENFRDEEILYSAAARLVTLAILDTMHAGQRAIIHNATPHLADSIAAEASEKNVEVIFTTTSEEGSRSSWLVLQSFAGTSEILQVLDPRASCLVDLSSRSNNLSTTLEKVVPLHCRKENLNTLCSTSVCDDNYKSGATDQLLRKLLLRTIDHELVATPPKTLEATNIGIDEATSTNNGKVNLNVLTCVDWNTCDLAPAQVCRYDVVPMFKAERTYWLCGLSGALGLSICDWMIDGGVRHMVISSRNPKVDQRWVDNHMRKGVTVKIMSCDVTDDAAMGVVYQEITRSLPPVAGVVSAAMVLRDVSVRNMEFEQLQEVIRPKVLGSINLDRIFHDVDLDFFIVLSSTNAIVGNPGQANYAAANMGMAGVAAARRERGLRASVAHVGAIMGVGYVTDSIERLELTVTMTNLIRVGEQDVHQMIAEVFEAGFKDSAVCPELIMGIKDVTSNDLGHSKWSKDPKFARLLSRSTAGTGTRGAAGSMKESIREDLQACSTEQQVYLALKQAYAAQLRKILFMELSDDDIMSSASSTLGLDSLIAVDIRLWILKTFGVSIPVLQIMSADTRISDLVNTTIRDLPAKMIPNIQRDEQASNDGSGSATDSSEMTGKTTVDGDASSATDISVDGSASPTKNGEQSVFDWDKEARTPEGIVKRAETPAGRTPGVVLLTGASGLLGHHLLSTLNEQSWVRKIICIAIRRLPERLESSEFPLVESGRIEYYPGDLALSRFGLTEAQQSDIFNQVDVVIHNGADTSHMKPYMALRDANVESTRCLIQLCVERHIPLHYISSAGIAILSEIRPFPSVRVSGHIKDLSADGSMGYACSKWVCERLLEDTNNHYGLPIWIHRPSTIIRQGHDAETQRASFDWVNMFLEYSHKIQAVPQIVNNQGALDLVHVQTCCNDIIAEVKGNKSRLASGMTYQNNVGDVVIPMERLSEIALEKGNLKPYRILPWVEWTEKAVAAGLHPAVAALIERVDEPGRPSYPLMTRASEPL